VIGRRALPEKYEEFNTRWGVPFGLPPASGVQLKQRHDDPRAEYGPFAFQLHSGTRVFEYPWSYFAAATSPGCRVLDIGGCVGGLQFVFATEGCRVVNVDPFEEGSGGWPTTRWPVGPDLHERLNQILGTDVELVRERVQDAGLAEGSFDRVTCLSVIEHLDQSDAEALVAHAGRLLAPGGLFVATIDLFLDLKPFGVLSRNCYGANVDVAALVASCGLELVAGDRRELFGFPEFDLDRIVAELDELLLSPTYPCLSQSVVLRKPS
jgi:2-polyprenyl-3-methyl-5-hydroxy-6-metoxy-1,4-benzoquinol methylase